MNEFGVFLYESGISLSVLYVFYWFLLRKETYFSLNRIILVSTLLLALIIPFIRITITGHTEQGSIIYVFDRFIMEPLVISPETVHAEKIQSISLVQIIYFIYFAGVIFFSLKFLVQFFQIFKLVKKYGTRELLGYKIVPIDNNLSPFSFFNFIFINPEKIQENELKNVLYHEGEHSRRLHTLDIILLEIICIIQWFNPFIWFYKLAIREIHEYEADLRVIKNGENKLNYQQLILQQVFGNQFFQVVHHLLTNSLTKKRITMMTKIESKKRTIIKSLFILPIAAILVMIFSFTRGTEPNDLTDNFELIKNGERIDPTGYFSDVEIDGLRNPGSKTPQEQDTIVYFTAEEMPVFNREGYSGFREYLMKNVKYPEKAKISGKTGKVYVQYIIDTKGKVRNAKVLRTVSVDDKDDVRVINAPLLKKEALRVIYSSSNSWEPGKNKGKPVNVQLVVPIQFMLNGDKKQEKPVTEEEIPEEEIFFIVEDMPSFQGKGLNGFRDWVINNLENPEIVDENAIIGTVYIQFVVEPDGLVKKVTLMRGVDPLLDAEALRVVKSSPQWKPGKQRGHAVRVAFTFPISFSLDETPTFMGEKELSGFRDWVAKELVYPEIAAEKGIEGIVYIQFVVNKKGNVEKVVIMRGADPLLDAEALRVVRSSPQWKPGKYKGAEVNVAFTLPVKFSLQEPEKTVPEEKVIPVEKIKQEKPVTEEEITEEEIFFIVEDMPSFQGKGLSGFREEWVLKQLKYPEIAAKKGIEGEVFVQFVVDKNGGVKNVVLMRGADPLLDAEALRVVKSSPQWIPGKQRGQVVNVAFTMPIKFVLQ